MRIYIVCAALLAAGCDAPKPENRAEAAKPVTNEDEIILKCLEKGEFVTEVANAPNLNKRESIDATVHYRVGLKSGIIEQWNGKVWSNNCLKGDKCEFAAKPDRISWSSLSIEDDGKEQRTRQNIMNFSRTSGALRTSSSDEFRQNYRLTVNIEQKTEGVCTKSAQPQRVIESQKF